MKKSLLFGVIVLLALGLAFTACEQPLTDYNLNVGHDSLSSPSLTVKKYPGGVLLTWEPVINTTGYQVWRQQTSPQQGPAVQLGTVTATGITRYADVKSLVNPLSAGSSYRYTVVAQSNSSTSGATVPNEVVQNSKSAQTVSFNATELPDTITLEPVTGLTLKETAAGSLYASWAGDANPLVSYRFPQRLPRLSISPGITAW